MPCLLCTQIPCLIDLQRLRNLYQLHLFNIYAASLQYNKIRSATVMRYFYLFIYVCLNTLKMPYIEV